MRLVIEGNRHRFLECFLIYARLDISISMVDEVVICGNKVVGKKEHDCYLDNIYAGHIEYLDVVIIHGSNLFQRR